MLKREVIERNFQTYLFETKRLIDSQLSLLVSRFSKLRLHQQIEYALLSEGKRLRPIMVILCAQSVGGNRDKVMSLALAFELVHTATLIHDDVIDKSELRRDILALHKKWCEIDAILTGDALIALAVNQASDFGIEVMKVISESALELCDGEYVDIHHLLNTTTEEEYFLKVRGKSASLFRAAAQCGALAGGGSYLEVESLAAFGEYLGVAYQVKDDIKDLTSEEHISHDLRNGRVTLPFIHLYGHGADHARKLLEENFGKRSVNRDVANKMLRAIEKTGSLTYCEQKVAENINNARAVITAFKDSEFKTYLICMSDLIAEY